MSGFSPEWLALREPVDHRSRSAALAGVVRAAFAHRTLSHVTDLGCGTGSNLRATAMLLPDRQSWRLVDYDERLLSAARAALRGWADRSETDADGLVLQKGSKRILVSFARIDLERDLEQALGPADGVAAPDLVTASAFFDLCAPAFITRFAQAVAARRASFYTVLTYNGDQHWLPPHRADAGMSAAFHAHQKTDKGFGAAAGPDAAVVIAKSLRAAGYDVREGDSPWVLDTTDASLIADLAKGFAAAVRETHQVPEAEIAAWLTVSRNGAVVGHTDTFAQPRARD